MSLVKAYIGTLVAFLVIDGLWIALVVIKFYERQVGHLMRETPSFVATALFYLAYVAGVVFLAVRPALASGAVAIAAINGAVIGALAYGTYTVTNYAIFRDWSTGLLVSDVVWGTFLTAVIAIAGYYAARL